MKVRAKNLAAGYDKGFVLASVDLEFHDGEMVGIIGPNGAGKSTLLKAVGRLLKPRGGTVYLDGKALRDMSPGELARRMAALPQTPISPPELTVYELVGYGRYPHVPWMKRLGPVDREVIERAIAECHLDGLAHRRLSTLSGGQRQRAWLAMTLAQEPQVMLLDEPVTFLDLRHQLEVMDLLAHLNRVRGILLIAVMHDINLASRYCSRLIALRDGRVVRDGAPHQVIQPQVLQEVFEVQAHVWHDPRTGRPQCLPAESLPREGDVP